jgi:hypothetical protein
VNNDNDPKTIDVTNVWYPVENIASFKLIPSFETNGAVVGLGGVELTGGTSVIDFTKPAAAGWDGLTKTDTKVVTRPVFPPVD